MDKKQKFINLLEKIEPKIESYSKYLNTKLSSKLIRFFLVKEKSFAKILAIFIKNFLGIDFKKKIKTFWGRDLYVYLADADASALYFFNTLYGDEIKIIKFLIKNFKENDIFYDVGANYGFYTLLAQEFITKGEIHAFEPNPKIFKLLRENSRLDIFKNTFLNEIALSDKIGETEFFDREISRHSGGSSLIKLPHFKKYRIINVKTTTLDEYILNHRPPTIIKIDVEGGEPLVLRGALNLIKKYKPLIIMEVGSDDLHREAINILMEENYQAFKINKDGELKFIEKENIFKETSFESNYIFKNETLFHNKEQILHK
jgi:FkbM family methyltransferase